MPLIPQQKSQYVDNELFYIEIKKYLEMRTKAKEERWNKEVPIPRYVGECIYLICNNLMKIGKFARYSFREDMAADAMENCLHRDTKIATLEYGVIEIAKILGKEVTVKARDGVWRTAVVKSYGEQDLYRYKFGSFNVKIEHLKLEVIATKNHRWFLEDGSETTNLNLGSYIEEAKSLEEMNADAVIHGLIYGDGTGHKKFAQKDDLVATQQGNFYASIRVCKQDKVRDEIVTLLSKAGYIPTYPPSAKGDPIFHLGRKPFIKEVPHTVDPSYISGFIHGWWLADGLKTDNTSFRQITTTNLDAVNWLIDHAGYAGYCVTTHKKSYEGSDVEKNGRFANAKPLYTVTLRSRGWKPKVRHVEFYGRDEVFCLEEPVTHGFVLANGLLTGNCIRYIHNFDPVKYKKPFAYFTQIAYFAAVRRIKVEKKQTVVKAEIIKNSNILDSLVDIQDHDDRTYINSAVEYMQEIIDAVDTKHTFVEPVKKKVTAKKTKPVKPAGFKKKTKQPDAQTIPTSDVQWTLSALD